MLERNWFKPEMPIRDLLLNVYEWVVDGNSTQMMGDRIIILQEESDRDSEGTLAYATIYAFLLHENCARIKYGNDVDDLRRWGAEMCAAYLTWIADPKQVLKDIEEIEEEDDEFEEEEEGC